MVAAYFGEDGRLGHFSKVKGFMGGWKVNGKNYELNFLGLFLKNRVHIISFLVDIC